MVDQDVGSAGGEPLVVDHVLSRAAGQHSALARHGPCRIADVLVEALRRLRRVVDRQRLAAAEEQLCLGRRRWRPLVELRPLLCAAVEHVRLRQVWFPVTAQERVEERELDLLAEERARVRPPVHVSERASRRAPPHAVGPGAEHDRVVDAGVQPLRALVDGLRAIGVLCVEPSADRHDRALDAGHAVGEAPRLPPLVEVRVRLEVGPELDVAFVVQLVDVAERAEVEEELVPVASGVVSRGAHTAVRVRLRPRLAEP
ncbi:MAG: hypothetical protein IIC78_14860, partial [Chloroflexi bacterium]|nr:hypothetical protein [Chloroflexota bacterium]